MGRGLSDLQKCILRLALENREAENRDDNSGGADVLTADVMEAFYGFVPVASRRCNSNSNAPGQRKHGCQVFSKSQIGDARYNAAAAAISRALTRLEKRGLICGVIGATSNWAGGNLTDEGAKTASGLSVNTAVS